MSPPYLLSQCLCYFAFSPLTTDDSSCCFSSILAFSNVTDYWTLNIWILYLSHSLTIWILLLSFFFSYFFVFLLIFVLCVWIFCQHVCLVCLVPGEARRGHWIPYGWYEPQWILVIKPMSLVRAASALNNRVIFLASFF